MAHFLRYSPLLALLAACAAVDYRQASGDDSEAAYRAFLAEHEEGEEAEQARRRLEELAFQRARRGDDIAAYNRFLAEFVEGDFAQEARELRARRRLEEAQAAGDEVSLRRLIDREPETGAARDARDELAQREARSLRHVDDVARLRAFLLAFPQSPARAEVERRLDDLLFAQALASGQLAPFQRYLEGHPEGIHRAEAAEAVERLEADRAIESGSAEEMERHLRAHPISTEAERVRQAAAAAYLERARRRLDPAGARRALELAPEGPSAQAAEQLSRRELRPTKGLATLQGLIADLFEGLEPRGPDELRPLIGSEDPRDRWNVLREVALGSDPASVDLAVELAGRGDPLLLLYARTALLTWADRHAALVRQPLEAWADRLRLRASNPEDLLRLGAVSEALGDPIAARAAFRHATQLSEDRRSAIIVAAASHWALLAAETLTGAESEQALETLVEVGRARLQDLLDAAEGETDAEGRLSALQVLRGLEAVVRVGEAVLRASSSPELREAGLEPPQAIDDLERLIAAAEAARRRLFVRLQQVAPELLEGADDPLTRRATESRRNQLAAIQRLAALRAQESVPALAEAAVLDGAEVGREAIRAIERIGGAPARAALLELARRRPAPHRRTLALALLALSRTAPASEGTSLLEAAAPLEEPNNEVSP